MFLLLDQKGFTYPAISLCLKGIENVACLFALNVDPALARIDFITLSKYNTDEILIICLPSFHPSLQNYAICLPLQLLSEDRERRAAGPVRITNMNNAKQMNREAYAVYQKSN